MLTHPGVAQALEIQWLGTAGFVLRSGDKTLLIDPYVTRNEKARPRQPLRPEAFHDAQAILITHGHFDHLTDVPGIVMNSPAKVYCSEEAGETLLRKGVPAERITVLTGKQSFSAAGFAVTACPSRHVTFDLPLVCRTLVQMRFHLLKYRPLLSDWPKGDVFSYRLEVEDLSLHHFGSAGPTPRELAALAEQPLDILMVPLQGHSRICRIGAGITRALLPKIVIPHHHDDFYPPISTMVDIEPFIAEVRRGCPAIRVRQLAVNQAWQVEADGLP